MNPDIKTSETKHKDTASQDRQHDRILTGSQALIESLLCEGTEVIFGYPGGQIIPVYDALYDFMGPDGYAKLQEKGVIEVAPLAYMRGRTLTDSFIILDEAQNTTNEQMKMFLTRFGENSKVVVTGDITQIDLPEERKSGLKKTADILSGIDGIEVIYLTNRDVVRHRLVKDIIKAFERYEKSKQK